MVSIQLTICGDNHELRLSCLLFTLDKVTWQVGGSEEIGIAGRIPVKRDAARQRAIIEKDGNAATARQGHQVWLCRINRRSSLPWSKHRIGNAALRQ